MVEMLSEHTLVGMLEGDLLTGRNGFTRQDPGFMDLAGNKKDSITRVYLPADANCLLAVAEPALQETDVTKGAGLWEWACNDDCGAEPDEPDVVLASAGDISSKECLATIELLGARIPSLKIRYVNVVKLFALASPKDHPHGLSDGDFTSLFTPEKPVIFSFHGYPWMVHRLTYNRPNHTNLHVRGYKKQGNINTSLELAISNQINRFDLVIDVINRVPSLGSRAAHAKEQMKEEILRHSAYAYEHGTDAAGINNWRWILGHSSCTV